MPISERVAKNMSEGSWIRRMFEEGIALKKRFGPDNVFDLSLGNPIMEPPPDFHRELKKLANGPLPGMHRYMENAGYADTRAAVAEQLSLDTGVSFTGDQVVMTCGAAAALTVVLRTLIDPGDEVLVLCPYFVEYAHYVSHAYGVVKEVRTDASFVPVFGTLEKAIGPKTRALIINSPNNPTGVVYDEHCLHQVGELLRAKERQYGSQICLISDEPYRKIVFDGLKFVSPLQHHPSSIIVTSHSKDLALPGERIGYLAVHPRYRGLEELMGGLIYCNRTLGFVNAPALMQHLVKHLQAVTVPVAEYQRKRDLIYRRLTEMGYTLVKPRGAFYMFPKSPIDDDVAFVRELQQWQVLAVPGTGFGGPGYFRISYCVDDHTIEGALAGFQKAARKYGLS
ncbi:MAG: pyridoxal phosphate-dependent aminotransferase [Chloroflexi bacterium]|nr:pyridoxal phosphate-dependent aminotransferase [Chloroflexota bacterium]